MSEVSRRPGLGARLAAIDDGRLMRGIFGLMLAGVAAVLFLDYRDMRMAAEATLPAEPLIPSAPGLPGTVDPDAPKITTDRDVLRGAMTIELAQGGELRLAGTITPGSGARFAEEVARSGEYVKLVVLDSPGGSVGDALEMSRLIREKGYATRVRSGSLCASSCPIVFSGGKERIAEKGAVIGVHQVSPVQTDPARPINGASQSQSVTAEISRHLDAMGVDPALWLHALETPPQDLYYLSAQEMDRYRLTTAVKAVKGKN